nr:MAG TPA: hypothetical protein [Caudoviricetes sp.]
MCSLYHTEYYLKRGSIGYNTTSFFLLAILLLILEIVTISN